MGIKREHPDFNSALNAAIDAVQKQGVEISDVEAFKRNVEAIEIVDTQLRFKIKDHAEVQQP